MLGRVGTSPLTSIRIGRTLQQRDISPYYHGGNQPIFVRNNWFSLNFESNVMIFYFFQQTAYRALPELDNDERLASLLYDFDKRYTGKDYSSRKQMEDSIHITPDMIDSLANKSFPPCMRHLHDTLQSTHHLKYNGRLIYGLFLKAAGLSLEDALNFWRSHFLENMDGDTVCKTLALYIQHFLC